MVNVDLSPTGSAAQQGTESGRVFPFMTRWVQVEAVTVSPNPAKADRGDRSAFTGAWEAEGKVSFRQVVTSNDPAIAPSLEEVTRFVPVERFLRGLRLDLLATMVADPGGNGGDATQVPSAQTQLVAAPEL